MKYISLLQSDTAFSQNNISFSKYEIRTRHKQGGQCGYCAEQVLSCKGSMDNIRKSFTIYLLNKFKHIVNVKRDVKPRVDYTFALDSTNCEMMHI